VSLGEVLVVLGNLLDEGIPVRNITRILEAVTSRARENRSIESLTEAARAAVGSVICEAAAQDGVLRAITFEPTLEQALLESVRPADQGTWLAIDGVRLAGLLDGIGSALTQAEDQGLRPAIVCAAPLRPAVRRMIAASRPDLFVVSYSELGRGITVEPVGEISLSPAIAAMQ